ncbi:MAG: HyaD/HybD family hydrogenase maturation endopeptidase [Deltaproteobacteria bacterium]|nr:HyaD/HybD family hydrogenase maturation endopeptidase [Deltaproteobacteria bacterium]
MKAPRVLALGVGNILMRDDGVGVHAVQVLADAYELPQNIRVVDGGVAGLRLLADVADSDFLLIVDAVRNGGEPGSIYHLGPEHIQPRRGLFVSAHQVGIAELLAAAEFSGRLPETQIIGVEPLDTDTVGLEISLPLRFALPRVVAAIVDTLHAHGIELKEKPRAGMQPCEPEGVDARVIDRP